MQLRVTPEDLHAAGARLAGVAARLDDVATGFGARARVTAPQLGHAAAQEALTGSRAAVDGVEVVAGDVQRLASALQSLARLYDRLDATAVPTGPPGR